MKDTNEIAREQQRRNAELAAEMREALRPMPPMTRTDGWTGYTWADLAAYAAQCVRDEKERCIKAVEAVPPHRWMDGSDQWGQPCPAKVPATKADYVAAIRRA